MTNSVGSATTTIQNRIETLGIIAGSRSLPLLLATQARAAGVRSIITAAFEGETDPAIAAVSDQVRWLRVGQLGKLIDFFKEHDVAHCAMAGQIAPKNLFDLRPDFRTLGLLLRIKEKNAHTLFAAIANELAKDGIELVEATPWLRPLMPVKGYRIGPTPSQQQLEDAAFGFRIAKEISRLEIGQTVVVKGGTVLAVEGFEGTDRCLQRGGELAGAKKGAVAVKVAKTGHDMRFDIPCAGLQTVEVCAKAGIEVLAVEAERTLVLDQDAMAAKLGKLGVSVIAVG